MTRTRRKRLISYHREKFLGVDITVTTVHYDPETAERMRAWIAERESSGAGGSSGVVCSKATSTLRARPRSRVTPTSSARAVHCTPSPRAVLRKFGLCRICFRELALRGEIPGVRKASW